MADTAKAKSAKDRLDAAKKQAEEAEIVEPAADKALDAATDAAENTADEVETLTQDAAETAEDAADAASGTDAADEADAANADDEVPADTPDEPAPEPHEEPHHAVAEEETGGSIAATILKFLVILIVGGAAALWAGPRIAPNLPGWAAPVAQFLTPGANETAARIDAVASETDGKIADLSDTLGGEIAKAADLATAAGDKADGAVAAVETAQADLTARIEGVAAEPRADIARMDDLATRLASAEATVQGLRAELDSLSGLSTEDAAPSAEVLARVAAFGAAVEGLRAEIADLKSRTTEIETLARNEDLAALTERVAALEGGEAATAGAHDDANAIRRAANIDAALTRIEQALVSGAPYAAALADATSLSGESPPDALSAYAETGLPTQESLIRAFPAAAQAAYAAALTQEAGDGFASGVLARLQGRLGGRPSTETAGDDAGAVLSRVEARLGEGRLDAALAEAGSLSEPVRAAMQGWLGDAGAASAGAQALTAFRDAATAN